MIHLVEVNLRRLRRLVSRSELSLRFLRLARSEHPESERGLVLIQIDGLSRTQLERALKKGRMPFLRRLLRREAYHLHTVYSGMPSTTPAAQGELFYGVRGCVPSFSFRDQDSGRIVAMLSPEAARKVERDLKGKGGKPLLRGGCAYSDIFMGGADEGHFCSVSLGLGDILRQVHWARFIPVAAWNARSILRLAALLFLEFFLAAYDALRGAIRLGEYRREFIFVFTRVFLSVGLRELVTILASLDVTRGIPVVHVNYNGYDEQAHRRGPSSLFAHFSLRGVDDAIKRLWHAAHRSSRRDYDVWIYSDHGQENVVSYWRENGCSIQQAAERIFRPKEVVPAQAKRDGGPEVSLGGQLEGFLLRGVRWVNTELAEAFPFLQRDVMVTSLGPIGHLYPAEPMDPERRDGMARRLVEEANIPMVLTAGTVPDAGVAFTAAGRFELPREAAAVLGGKHPFLEECARDLVRICHHSNAGTFVLCGWRPRGRPVTFAIENGAHGGPGYEETRAFALLPGDAPLPGYQGYLRHSQLREAALHVRGQRSALLDYRRKARMAERTVRIMTYNVHGCVGMDGRLSTSRIARVIDHYEPDIVALQECRHYPPGHGYRNQAEAIAQKLMSRFHFPSALQVEQDDYGNAVLSTLPLKLKKRDRLPTLPNRPLEERGALWVEIQFHGQKLQFFNTHLGLMSQERLLQAQFLMGEEWLASPRCEEPLILCGDFNAFPWSAAYRQFTHRLYEAQENMAWHKPLGTFWGRYPVSRIDHIFCSVGIETLKVEVPRSQLTRLASDHLPIIAELLIP